MFKDMTPAAWAELVGGFFIFVYILTDVIKKLIDRSKWGQKMKEEKEQMKREIAHKQYREFTDEFVNSFVPPLMKQLTDQDEKLNSKIDLLTKSSNDLLRMDMNEIYYRYLPYKKILDYDRKCFIKLYDDYVEQGGNSYIQDINTELRSWEIVATKEDLTK